MGKSRARKKREKEEEVNAAEVAMAKAVQRVQEIFREHSEEEIRAMLLQCNMNQKFAIDRLLSQQDAKKEQGASNQLPDSSTTTSSILVPNQSDVTNGETTSVPISSSEAVTSLSVPSSSDVTNGESRSVPISSTVAVPSFSVPSSSDVTNSETKSVLVSSNVALLSLPVPSTSDVTNGESRSVPISSTEAVPPLSLPSSSDTTNGETRSVTISSKVAAPLSVPSSRAPTNVKTKRQQAYRIISASDPSWADLFKTPDATNRSSTESDAARRAQLQESALLIPNPPQNSAFHVNQPMDTTRQQSTATASSPPGPRQPISMADLNSFFSSAGFQQRSGSNSYTLAHDGDMTNPHYLWRQEQNNVPSSEAQQQRGGTNNDTSLYHSLDSVFSQYRNNSMPPSATSSDVTSGTAANSSCTSSIGPSSHASAYGVGMPSGNAANSRPWSVSIPRVHLPSSNSSGGTSSIGPSSSHVNGSNSRLGYGDYLPPVHLQGSRSSNEWTVQSEEIYFIPSHWRSPGYRPSQQEREEYRGIGYERLRAYNASLNQENNTSDPSDQTQQRPRDK